MSYHSYSVHARNAATFVDEFLYDETAQRIERIVKQYHDGLITREELILTLNVVTAEALVQ